MNNEKIVELIDQIKHLVEELESEVKSDPGRYTLPEPHYNDVVWYYSNDNDDDEEGL